MQCAKRAKFYACFRSVGLVIGVNSAKYFLANKIGRCSFLIAFFKFFFEGLLDYILGWIHSGQSLPP